MKSLITILIFISLNIFANDCKKTIDYQIKTSNLIAEKRIALIISVNDTTPGIDLLKNTLVSNKIKVWHTANNSTLELKAVLEKFVETAIKTNSSIIIYYAGHGFLNNNNTFLSTTDGYIALNYIYQRISKIKNAKVLMINTCRKIDNNITINSKHKISEYLPDNTFVLFSASINKVVPNSSNFIELICRAINNTMEINEFVIYINNNNTCNCLSPVSQSTMKQKYYINQLNR